MSAALSTFSGLIVIVTAGLLRQERSSRNQDFFTALGFALYIAAGIKLHLAIVHWFPKTLDPQFLHYDQELGFDPLRVMEAARQHPAVLGFLEASYWLLSTMLGLAWVVEQNRVLRLAAFLAGTFCFAFYMLFPAVGPVFYKWNAGLALNAPRNCMPSMHLSWAILMAWNAKRLHWRLLFTTYALIMAAATLAIGQHYLIDLLAALPYVAVIQVVAARLIHPNKIQAPVSPPRAPETWVRNLGGPGAHEYCARELRAGEVNGRQPK